MGRTTEKSERASELSIEHMNTLLNSIHVQIWYVTDDHTYGMVNKAHADFNGCDIEDLVFKNMYDIFDEEVVDVWLEGNRKEGVFSSLRCQCLVLSWAAYLGDRAPATGSHVPRMRRHRLHSGQDRAGDREEQHG